MSYFSDYMCLVSADELAPSYRTAAKQDLSAEPFPAISRLVQRISGWWRGHADVAALRRMTDRDLRDMGLSRLDLEAISAGAYRFKT
jgi:uncharacterized protein YjiS (DUF1127 family)